MRVECSAESPLWSWRPLIEAPCPPGMRDLYPFLNLHVQFTVCSVLILMF